MRKILLSLLCLFFIQQAFANIHQTTYRWRNDNGSQTTATWKTAENTELIIFGKVDNYRLRLGFDGDCCNRTFSQSGRLMYSVRGSGIWTEINTSSNAAFMLAGSSPYVTNNEATTQQLSNSAGGAFVAGRVITNTSPITITLNTGQRTEFEWVIKPGTTIQTNTTYDFMFSAQDAVVNVLATLVTSSTLPLQFVSITASQVGNTIQLQWSTSNEVNVKHFEIERSTDGTHYTTLHQLTANGNNHQNTRYHFTDAAPNTRNYYRLKAVDADGSYSYSKIVPVLLSTNGKALNVFPNPSKNKLQIQLQAPEGKVQVILLDATGRTLKHFDAVSDGNLLYAHADISSLTPGIYFIKYHQEIVKFIKE